MTAVDLTTLIADAVADNPARVLEVANLAAAMHDDVPVVMLPVRIETRFVQVPAPVAVPVTLHDLADRLAEAAAALGLIATTNLATTRAPTAAQQQQFKKQFENPMCDLVAARLDAAAAALAAADVLLRQNLDGAPDLVVAAIANVRSELSGAATSLAALRSDWQRERLQTQLESLATHAATTLATIETSTLPAARLRADLIAATAPAPGAPSISPVVLAAGAAAFQSVLTGLETVHADPAAVAALTDTATTIALLPAAWKAQLTDAVTAAQARGGTPPGDLDRLAATVATIRSDSDAQIVVVQPAPLADELLVRIYPDDIAVDTHEEALTAAETDAGAAYWQQHAAAGADEPSRRAAWRALCAGRGSRRAAWIAHLTEPPVIEPAAGADLADQIFAALTAFERRVAEVAKAPPGTRIGALLRAARVLAEVVSTGGMVPKSAIDTAQARWTVLRASLTRLENEAQRLGQPPDDAARDARAQLDTLLDRIGTTIEQLRPSDPGPHAAPDVGPAKDGAWTRAARSGVLPERFLVVAVSGDRPVHVVAGNPVPADLKLSIDPAPADPAAEEFTVDAQGNLTVGASIRWMVDYDEALAKGMAVTLPITPQEAQHGFDRIYVIGLRADDPDGGAGRVQDLLDNHHYGRSGLALVPIGTPTNNTEQSASGFRSVDDPDQSFAVEAGAPLVDPAQAFDAAACDGLRVARALGVAPQTFAHVSAADGRDGAEAQTATAALYPATIGSWLFDNAAPLISRDTRERLSAFALAHVAARGLVGSLRVGSQPYGLLPAMAHSLYVADAAETPGALHDPQQRFDDLLAGVLLTAADDWSQVRELHVSPATDTRIGDERGHLLELLGLEAVSSTASYRFAVNVAGRHGVVSDDPNLQFGLPSSDPEANPSGAQYGPFALLQRYQAVLEQAFDVAAGAAVTVKGQISAEYADVYRRIQDSRAYELRLLGNAHELTGPLTGADPAGDIAAVIAGPPGAVAQQTRTHERDRPLLALLARQARLVALRDAALAILVAENLLSEQDIVLAGSSTNFLVASLTAPETLTPWTYLFATLADIGVRQGTGFTSSPLATYLDNGRLSLSDFLSTDGATGVAGYKSGAYAAQAQALARHAAALTELAALPAERQAALVREHLDLAGHRLDAWITGLAHRRLTALRATTPIGAHIAAYGWVEDLTPQDAGDHPLATNVPEALNDPSRPIHTDRTSEGFVHAPSINHAVTAAILRGGYVSQRSEGDVENRMAVNLSSRRTRLAIGLIEGVRAGNTLGALLGYRLERFLHEYHAGGGVTLDAVIGPLRTAFPSIAGVDSTLHPDVAARQVCDGLAIADTALRWIARQPVNTTAGLTVYDVLSSGNYSGYPWDLGSALPLQSDRLHLDGVVRAIDHVADALDAIGDVVIAEGVHQIVMGNHARAAAVLSALGEGKAPPAPEVVATPRTGTPLSHRILLALADEPNGPAGWDAIALSPRARAEPALNAWAAGLLGAPDTIRMRLVHAASDHAPVAEVTVADLGLHALDLVAILGPGLETGLGEIAARALDARHPADLDDDVPPVALQVDITTRTPAWGADVRTLGEIAPLAEAIGTVLGRGRPADAHDYLLAEQAPEGTGAGVDLEELATRVSASRNALDTVAVDLLRLLTGDATLDASALPADGRKLLAAQDPVPDPPYWATRESWRAVLLRAAAFGIPAALPPTSYLSRVQVRRALRVAGETAFVEIVQRRSAVAEALSGTPSVSAITAATRALFGSGFTLVPRCTLRNRAELDVSLGAHRATPQQIDGWLEGLAAVREGCAGLADLLVLADAHDVAAPLAEIAQLPHVQGEPWMGDELPPGVDPEGRLSLTVLAPGALPADGASGASLLVDQWTEIVPSAAETTGVAVHYDQPDSTAPQCVLVAVPAHKTGNWQLGHLVQTLHDTLELAKSRAVELEHLQTTMYGQLLPAISGEVVPKAAAMPSSDGRVILDLGANN